MLSKLIDYNDVVNVEAFKQHLLMAKIREGLRETYISNIRTIIFDKDLTDRLQFLDKIIIFIAETPQHLTFSSATLERFVKQVLLNEQERISVKQVYMNTFLTFYKMLNETPNMPPLEDMATNLIGANIDFSRIESSMALFNKDSTKDQLILQELSHYNEKKTMRENANLMVPLALLYHDVEDLLAELIELRTKQINDIDEVSNETH